jgi:hypothetical protein
MTPEDRIRTDASTKTFFECLIAIIILLLGVFVIRGWRTTIAAVGGAIVGWLLLDIAQRGDSEQRARIEEAREDAADDANEDATSGSAVQLRIMERSFQAWMSRATLLEVALEEAISQCQAHNANYHAFTPTEMIDGWKHIASPERVNELITGIYDTEA